MHLNKIYQECENEKFEMKAHIFYIKDDDTCKLQVPTTNGSLPGDIEKDLMGMFVQKSFNYVQSPYGAFVTEAFVSGVNVDELSKEQQEALKKCETGKEQDAFMKSLAEDSKYFNKEERVIINFMVSEDHKKTLKKSIMIFTKKWTGDNYLLVPDKHHVDGEDSVQVGGRFNDLM